MSGILQKIRRNEKKGEKIKSKIFFQKSKTGNVLGRSLRLCKKFWMGDLKITPPLFFAKISQKGGGYL